MSIKHDDGKKQMLLTPEKDERLPSEEQKESSKCPKTWKFAVTVLFICALFLVGVIVGFYISQTYEPYRPQCKSSSATGNSAYQQGDREYDDGSTPVTYDDDPVKLSKLHESVINFVPTENPPIKNLATFADYQLHSGHDIDLEVITLLRDHFNACRFDDQSVEHYDVLISLPSSERPSRLLAFDKTTNQTIVETDFTSLTNAGSLPGFVAYSPNASVEGELIYLNRGTLDDYDRETSKGFEGKIGLVRVGQSTLEEKVRLAECHGLIGLLIVEDSDELHHLHSKQHLCTDVTPYSVFHIPPGGDPLTPSFPAIDGVWRLPLDEVNLPKIPLQTVSCETARKLLNQLKISGTTHSSGDLESPAVMVRLEVSNQLLRKSIQNVISTLYGDRDSDYSILVGANRNSFSTGSSGGIPGTEVLIRLSSAISRILQEQNEPLWIPRRTIRFVSWGGSDFGYLGFTEFLEKYHSIWRNKLIAYIDLDNPSKSHKLPKSDVGDQIVVTSSASVEVLTNMIVEQLRGKDNSIPGAIWQSVAKKSHVGNHRHPEISSAALLRKHLPAPYIHLQVTDDAGNEESESGYMVARIASLLTLTLADSGVFHFQVHRTAQEATTDVNRLINNFADKLPNVTIETFHSQLKRLKKATMELEDYIRRHLEYEKSEDVRMVNSALLQLEAEMTLIQVDVTEMQSRYQSNRGRCVATNDLCPHPKNPEIQLIKDMSQLLSRVMAATKVTDLAG